MCYTIEVSVSRSDGIGRRTGLKIQRWQHRAGSSPAFGTIQYSVFARYYKRVEMHILKARRALRLTCFYSFLRLHSQQFSVEFIEYGDGVEFFLGHNVRINIDVVL